jgi:hypothetical protein
MKILLVELVEDDERIALPLVEVLMDNTTMLSMWLWMEKVPGILGNVLFMT